MFLSDDAVRPYTYPAYRLAHLADHLKLEAKVQQWNQTIRAAIVLTAMVEDLVETMGHGRGEMDLALRELDGWRDDSASENVIVKIEHPTYLGEQKTCYDCLITWFRT